MSREQCFKQGPKHEPHLCQIFFSYMKACILHGVRHQPPLTMSSFNFQFQLCFTGRDDPRDECMVMGEDAKPVFFEFETAMLSPFTTRTTVRVS